MAEFNADLAKKIQRKRKAKVRESVIEADGKERVKAAGGFSAKFKSPGFRSRPDQIEFYGAGPLAQAVAALTGRVITFEEATQVLSAAIQLTEYKAQGEKPTEAQLREHARFRTLGFTVNVIDQRTSKEPK